MNKQKIKKIRKKRHELNYEKVDWGRVEKIFAPDRKLILEQINKQGNKKRTPHVKEILKILAVGAVIGLSLYIPALPMAIAPFIVKRDKYEPYRLNQMVKRLRRKKLVEIIDKNGQTIVKITDKGRVRALQYKLEDMKINKPKIWDRKWRIVIFDIPEKVKKARDLFRSHLKMMGFYNLQESVWVHPYPCFNQIEYLRQIYGVDVNVSYILAEKIEQSEDLLDYFKQNKLLS